MLFVAQHLGPLFKLESSFSETKWFLCCSFAFVFKALGDQIIFVNRPDKKKILFYNDKSCQFTVDEGGCLFTLISVMVDVNSSQTPICISSLQVLQSFKVVMNKYPAVRRIVYIKTRIARLASDFRGHILWFVVNILEHGTRNPMIIFKCRRNRKITLYTLISLCKGQPKPKKNGFWVQVCFVFLPVY